MSIVTGLRDAVAQLKAIGKPFLNWSGKAERTSFDVPSLPLFIHERLSTKAILETLRGHKRDKQIDMFDLFGDPQHSGTDQVLRAYEPVSYTHLSRPRCACIRRCCPRTRNDGLLRSDDAHG